MGVLSAHAVLNLDAKPVELLQRKQLYKADGGFIQVKKNPFSKYFSCQNGEQSVATMHI